MSFSIPEPWQSLINLFSLILCLLTIWKLFRKSPRPATRDNQGPLQTGVPNSDFKGDVHLAVLNQELNRSFASLSKMIEKKHLHLSTLIAGNQSPSNLPSAPSQTVAQTGTPTTNTPDYSVPKDSRQRVMDLHQKGVSPATIAAQLKIPRGEVELMVKMATVADPPPNRPKPD